MGDFGVLWFVMKLEDIRSGDRQKFDIEIEIATTIKYHRFSELSQSNIYQLTILEEF